ncbi:MAG: cupredoxin domain-containing protein [Chloroflexota bacterium]
MRNLARLVVLIAASVSGLAACGGSDEPAPSVTTTAGVGPIEVALRIIAEDIAFQPADLSAPAGVGLAVTFDHRDAGIPHNLVLMGDAGFSTKLAETEIVNGPATLLLEVPGLIPGSYRFTCAVHPNMITELTIEP